MENGHEEILAERFSQVGIEDSSLLQERDFKNDNLLQIIKAVEAAETTIKQQKPDESLLQTSNLGDHSNTTTVSRLVHQPVEHEKTVIKASDVDSLGIVVVHSHLNSNGEKSTVSDRFESSSEQNMVNGSLSKEL
ncbi:unnamed protein product [Eruca vesicaria subsp. sativa]|uniref:Uncharacterized protein n=1 Tax=Eruca vesicaria subsp. sativa TaxID=29727 RepID=A0ABC8LWH4_ERUVS|nr:unnamed protein product [Eruca vesicaria subsp. sativa]